MSLALGCNQIPSVVIGDGLRYITASRSYDTYPRSIRTNRRLKVRRLHCAATLVTDAPSQTVILLGTHRRIGDCGNAVAMLRYFNFNWKFFVYFCKVLEFERKAPPTKAWGWSTSVLYETVHAYKDMNLEG